MGKLSGIFIIMLMINIIGYIALTDYVGAYPNIDTTRSQLIQDNPLLSLYSNGIADDGNMTYYLGNGSALYTSTPTTPDASVLSGITTFIDRIFIMFGWVRTMIAIALFPITLFSIIGLPWQLAMLLAMPLGALYIFGIIDIFSSSGT